MYYDFEQPTRLPGKSPPLSSRVTINSILVELKGRFDRIIVDPPFLSSDCQTKGEPPSRKSRILTNTSRIAALSVRWLSRHWTAPPESLQDDGTALRLIVCTGERMETLVNKLYGKVGLHTTTFEPQHSKGLSNEFRCYANFECNAWEWR